MNTALDLAAAAPPAPRPSLREWRARRLCAVFGHELDNRTLRAGEAAVPCARCLEPVLHEDGRLTHTGHVLGCFLRHHTYTFVAARHGHREYACLRCGHPLLFEASRDPYAQETVFAKRVRYRCGLVGHDVHEVGERDGFAEYACGCGHPFLVEGRGRRRVTHPLVCVASGHRVGFLTRRDGLREHRCVDCGHTFVVRPPAELSGR
ncbi:MAG TPA: hypothetical protein VMR21_03040 [Vicinamibacteria bacterium]|nr:hypothetical protein [Vicinamibacteria bacterium]